jgi:hypothetical protein
LQPNSCFFIPSGKDYTVTFFNQLFNRCRANALCSARYNKHGLILLVIIMTDEAVARSAALFTAKTTG